MEKGEADCLFLIQRIRNVPSSSQKEENIRHRSAKTRGSSFICELKSNCFVKFKASNKLAKEVSSHIK